MNAFSSNEPLSWEYWIVYLVYIQNYSGHGTNKAAVETMMKYAATELGEFGIRVNCVSGGPIDTDALKAFTNYEEVKEKTKECMRKVDSQ